MAGGPSFLCLGLFIEPSASECLFSRDTDISLSKLLRERMKNSDVTGHYATSVSRATSFGRPVQTLLTDERSNKKV